MQYIIISPEQPHIHRTLLSTSARLMDLLKLLKVEQAARVCQLENLHQSATPASTATDQGVAVHDDDGPPEEPFLHLGRKSPSLLLWDTSSVAATFNRTINAVENIGAPRRGGGRGEQCQARQCSPVSSINPWVFRVEGGFCG